MAVGELTQRLELGGTAVTLYCYADVSAPLAVQVVRNAGHATINEYLSTDDARTFAAALIAAADAVDTAREEVAS